jgi:inner membrane protein
MTGATHAAIGAMAGAALGRLTGAHDVSLVLFGAAGALLPDLDQPGSKAWRKLLPLAAAAIGTQYLGVQLPRPVLAATLAAVGLLLFGLATGHRGATHSLLALAGSGALFLATRSGLHGAATWTGMATHLLADLLTPEGVPVFWPAQSRQSLAVARTGGLVDLLLGAGSLAATAALLLR